MTSHSFLSDVARVTTNEEPAAAAVVGVGEGETTKQMEENLTSPRPSPFVIHTSHTMTSSSSSMTVTETARLITKSTVSMATTEEKACLTLFEDDDVIIVTSPTAEIMKRSMSLPSLHPSEPEVVSDQAADEGVADLAADDDVTEQDGNNSDCDTGIGDVTSEHDPDESRNLPKIDEIPEDPGIPREADDDEVEVEEVRKMVPPPPKLIEKVVVEEAKPTPTSRKKSFIALVPSPQPPSTPKKKSDDDAKLRLLRAMQRKKKAQERFDEMKTRRQSMFGPIDELSSEEADRKISNFLEPYCIIDPKLVGYYDRVFTTYDEDGDGYLTGGEALDALDYVLPDVPDADIEYIYRILELANLPVFSGKMNQNLFNVVLSLTRRINSLDDFMRGLLDRVDFQTLDSKFYLARKLFQRLIDNHAQQTMSIDCLLWEIEAGGLSRSDDKEIRRSLSDFSHFDIIDFLTYLPLFTYIHSHVVGNPLEIFNT